MTSGIYGYWDNVKDEIIYIGQAQNIHFRHKQHLRKSFYNSQQINKVLQNNPKRYELLILKKCDIKNLDYWEITLIALFNPKFNFCNGGNTSRGYRHSDESKKLISINNATNRKEVRDKISLWHQNKKESLEQKINISKGMNGSNKYFRVSKRYDSRYTQGFIYVYRCYINKKRIQIVATNIDKLKEKVLAKGYEWKEISRI